MTVAKLSETLQYQPFTLPAPDNPVTGGYVGDLLSWVMGRAKTGDAWVTIMSNANVAAVALMADAACVILSENVQPDEALLSRAKQQGINLLGSEKSSFTIAKEIADYLGS